MPKESFCENYPPWIVLVSNLVSFSIYLIGAFIIHSIGTIWLAPYLLYILFLEIRLLKRSCVNCYYYGKYCAFGQGKLCSLFFKRGTKKLANVRVTWKDVIPDFMVTVVPMAAAAWLLMTGFSWLFLALLAALFLLGFAGTGMVRGKLACRYCRQRELGCPAEKLFGKKRK